MKASVLRRAERMARQPFHNPACAIKAEWQAFLARMDFEFSEDALSHETVSIEAAGFEEGYLMPGHGYQSVHDYIDWINDGEDARFESN